MASLIQKVAQEAHIAFRHMKHNPDINKLKEVLGKVMAADINLDMKTIFNESPDISDSESAPVKYIPIWKDYIFTMGVFILKSGTEIPLHDHPGMTGLVRVLHGDASIQSYSPTSDFFKQSNQLSLDNETLSKLRLSSNCNLKMAKKHAPIILTPDTSVGVLRPSDNNFHCVKAVDGATAFLDVISPPYDDDDKCCTYYEEIKGDVCDSELTTGKKSKDFAKLSLLVEIPRPDSFWCQMAPYEGDVITSP